MFNYGSFLSHSGKSLKWKIECDDITDKDLDCIARIVSSKIQYSKVIGIPTGGLRFAKALEKYTTESIIELVADDVLTTGKSFEEYKKPGRVGVVLFARGECPDWVVPIFKLNTMWRH